MKFVSNHNEQDELTVKDRLFKVLYDQHNLALMVYAEHLCKTTYIDARDLLHDFWLHVFLNEKRLSKMAEKNTAYWCAALRNYFLSSICKIKASTNVSEVYDPLDASSIEGMANLGEEAAKCGMEIIPLMEEINKVLNKREQYIFYERVFGRKYSEIASYLKISENSVRIIFHRAKMKLEPPVTQYIHRVVIEH